jgi:hypothetical protein
MIVESLRPGHHTCHRLRTLLSLGNARLLEDPAVAGSAGPVTLGPFRSCKPSCSHSHVRILSTTVTQAGEDWWTIDHRNAIIVSSCASVIQMIFITL